MDSFDQSLKYLLHQEPADFLRFGSGQSAIDVLSPIPSDLPSRGRDVDAGYLIDHAGTRMVAHVELHRRHQGIRDLALDVAEAQIRLFRREKLPVLSQVWDLYGRPDEPLLRRRRLTYGAAGGKAGSRAVYLRVNLRALGAAELLSRAPPGLWPLVALTRDGATEEGVRRARDAIMARPDLSGAERADHLAVLWFVAEAESVPVRALMVYISEERLMESALYKSIFENGEARGEARGEAMAEARLILRVLVHRLGAVEPDVEARILQAPSPETLRIWAEEATMVVDAADARRLVEKIRSAPLAA